MTRAFSYNRKPHLGYTTDQVVGFYRDMGLRNAHDWKRKSTEEVDRWIRDNVPAMTPVYAMREHQKRAFCLGLIDQKFYFQLDMGLGKSKVVLDIILTKRKLDLVHRTLVLVPGSLNLSQWRDQAKQHAPELSVLLCNKGTGSFLEQSKQEQDVCVMTYAASILVYKKDPEFFQEFDCLVLDESSSFRSHDSVTFRMLKGLAPKIKSIYLLSGTPFSKTAMGLWSQFYLLDKGELLGRTVTEFRRRFFIEKVTRWGTEWVLHPDREELLFRVLHHKSIRYKTDECEDLPEELTRTIESTATKEQEALFLELQETKQELLDANLSVGHLDNHLRLLSCGVRSVGQSHQVLESNPKLEALLDLLDEIENVMGEEQVIVVHHSLVLTDVLLVALKSRKIKAVAVNGTMSPSQKDIAISRFTNGAVRVLVANSTAAYGLNLQSNCRIMIFFEHHEDMLIREQIKKRIYRIGQKRKVYYYDLTLNIGKDEKALATLTTRRNRLARTVDGHKAETPRRTKRIKR